MKQGLWAKLNKSLAARASSLRAVCGVANPRHSGGYGKDLCLAAHPPARRAHSRGLIQRRLCAIGGWLLIGGATAGCPLTAADGQQLEGNGLQLAWKLADQGGIALSEAFTIVVSACPADIELLGVDATMPAHRHGMNYKPSIEAIGAGHWRVQGLLWHMRGRWDLLFELRQGGQIKSLRQTVELP